MALKRKHVDPLAARHGRRASCAAGVVDLHESVLLDAQELLEYEDFGYNPGDYDFVGFYTTEPEPQPAPLDWSEYDDYWYED